MTTVNVCSHTWHRAESYGRLARELAHGLSGLGVHVNHIGHDAPGKPVRPALGGILFGYPTAFNGFGVMAEAGPRVAITMFESTRLPDGWAERLNQCSAVIVPTLWQVQVFRESGVHVPLHVIPLGISDVFKRPARRDAQRKPFTFLAFVDRGRRKGWVHAVIAFNQAFGNDMAYRLVLKGRGEPLPILNPNIEVITGDMDDQQLASLYKRAHVMIAANLGEGFGFLPREFAATGGLALATNWGGTADDIQQWGLPIPASTQPAWPDKAAWSGKLGEWADPDVDALADMLRYVADHYDSYQDFTVRAAGFVQSHYRWSLYAKQVLRVWEGVNDGNGTAVVSPAS